MGFVLADRSISESQCIDKVSNQIMKSLHDLLEWHRVIKKPSSNRGLDLFLSADGCIGAFHIHYSVAKVIIFILLTKLLQEKCRNKLVSTLLLSICRKNDSRILLNKRPY